MEDFTKARETKRMGLYAILKSIYAKLVEHNCEKKAIRDWRKQGQPVPSPKVVKRKIIKEYAKKFSIHILLETGTYHGATIDAARNTFSRIFSIELSKLLYERAKEKFSKYNHISIIKGDSGEVLPGILSNISQPCLFWLDAHYSRLDTVKGKTETSVMQELQHILNHPVEGHVILIDDARMPFIQNKDDWPTIEELRRMVFKKHPDWIFKVKHDIIRIHRPLSRWQYLKNIIPNLFYKL